jgi:alkylated DNA repair protein (DNA oxidative demethylase)
MERTAPKLSALLPRSALRPGQTLQVNGFEVYQALLTPADQALLVDAVRTVVVAAPLIAPITPGGRQMSVRMTSAGRVGWITDRQGYRYAPQHPSGAPWPPIPAPVLDLWHHVTGLGRAPDCCLVNFYGPGARMGLHQDRDEGDFAWPVLSISLGDDALFRMGGPDRSDPTRSLWLSSGDVVVMGGPARLAWHGVDRVRHGSSRLLAQGGRLNLTLRVVQDPDLRPGHPS